MSRAALALCALLLGCSPSPGVCGTNFWERLAANVAAPDGAGPSTACTVFPGSESDPGPDPDSLAGDVGDGGACAPAAGDDACVGCAKAACCAEALACAGDDACTGSADPAFAAVAACFAAHCTAQCPGVP